MENFFELELAKNLSDEQRSLFFNEMASRRKSKTTGVLLTLFLGGVGAHQYYLGSLGWGLMYTLFCWTLIPALLAFIELFLISDRVEKYNQKQAGIVVEKLNQLFANPLSEPEKLATHQSFKLTQSASASNDGIMIISGLIFLTLLAMLASIFNS